MSRSLNFAAFAFMCATMFGAFVVSEEARVTKAELSATRTAIKRETATLSVLGAEWASLTQPKRIEQLAQTHLDLSDKPVLQLSSLSDLPSKEERLPPESAIRNANAIVPQTAPPVPATPRAPANDAAAPQPEKNPATPDTGT